MHARRPTPTLAQTAADLLEHLQVDLVGLAAAAVLLGVGQARAGRPAPERAEDLAREGLGGLGLGRTAARELALVAISRVSASRSAGLLGGQLAAGCHVAHVTREGRNRPIGQVRGWPHR